MKNYYEVLGVSLNSETEVITAAYKAMMRKYHPDTNKSPSAEKKAKEINEAYEVLKSAVSRREHDAELKRDAARNAPPPPPPPPPAPPPPPPPPATESAASKPEGEREKSPFVGEQDELRIWVIFAAAYAAIALLYFGPTWISASLEAGDVSFWAEVAGAAIVPFGLGFLGMKLWRALSSSEAEPKVDRVRWLLVQLTLIVIMVFNNAMLEKAREEDAGATTAEAASSEKSASCYSYSEQQKWTDAATPCLEAAEANDAKAQYILARMYMAGNGVEESSETAQSWYLKSASLGFPASQHAVGVGYLTGALTQDGKEDTVQAAIWLKKSADQGFVNAQLLLSSMHEEGVGVEKNSNEALRWLKLAAEQGSDEANKRLAEWKAVPKAAISGAAIPANFHGEWNEDRNACGTDFNDSKLVISESRLSFWESDAFVKSLQINNPRSVTVTANYKGEGQSWSNTITLNLSRSEQELTIDDFTRYKCP